MMYFVYLALLSYTALDVRLTSLYFVGLKESVLYFTSLDCAALRCATLRVARLCLGGLAEYSGLGFTSLHWDSRCFASLDSAQTLLRLRGLLIIPGFTSLRSAGLFSTELCAAILCFVVG